MISNDVIKSEVMALNDYLIQKRRDIHKLAEISGTEFDTRSYLENEFKEDGIEFIEVPDTSIIGILDSGKEGPTVLLRTDMDALPMPENARNLKTERVCMSRTPDKTCHACGHDAHMAMLLTAAKFLAAHRQELIGKVIFACEEGEENGAGWERLLNAIDERFKIDACWGIHVYAGMPSGKACVQGGPRMAGVSGVDLTFRGKGGHGSRPDQAINPVYCAANFYNNMAVAFANQIDANQTVTLGLTSIQGGEVANVIPDTARVLGSLRFFDVDEGAKAVRIVKEVAEHTAAMHHCTVEYASKIGLAQGPTVNDAELAALAEKKLPEVLPEGFITKWEPWYASESFGSYLRRYRGVFMHLGINNEEKGTGAAHHNTFFDVDEDVLIYGALSTVKYTLSIQEQFENKG